jgi:RNA polymerase sigma factor (sigma-70 family)
MWTHLLVDGRVSTIQRWMPVDSGTVAEQEERWREATVLYYPRVRGWYARVLTDQAAIEDLAQEVFVRLYDQFAKGESMTNTWNYLKVMARNVFLEHLRARKRQRALRPLNEAAAASTSAGPAEICQQEELSQAVPELLDRLSAPQRALLVGRYFFGMTMRDLAQTAGTSASTVVDHHNRALCRLRELAVNRGVEL